MPSVDTVEYRSYLPSVEESFNSMLMASLFYIEKQ